MIDLPPELAALINAERAAKVASAAERVVVRAKLAASVGAAPLGSAAVGATLAGAGKALAIVAITLAVGGGAALALRDDAPSTRPPTHAMTSSKRGVEDVSPKPDEAVVILPAIVIAPQSPVATPSPVIADLAPAAAVPSASTHLARRDASRPAPRDIAASPANEPDISLDASMTAENVAPPMRSQVELVREAWAALSSGDAPHALALADEDMRAHRTGVLAEEREAVRVVALARLNRNAAAKTAAALFLDLYPTSVHRALVQRAITDQESR